MNKLVSAIRKIVKEEISLNENDVLDEIFEVISGTISRWVPAIKSSSVPVDEVTEAIFGDLTRGGFSIIRDDYMNEDEKGAVKLKKGTPNSDIKKFTDEDLDVELYEDESDDFLKKAERSHSTQADILKPALKFLKKNLSPEGWKVVIEFMKGAANGGSNRSWKLHKLANAFGFEPESPSFNDEGFTLTDLTSYSNKVLRKLIDTGDLVSGPVKGRYVAKANGVNESDDEDEDDSIDDDKLDKQAAKSAKKSKGKSKEFDNLITMKLSLEKEMQSLAKKYKTSEGDAKARIIAQLKQKTQQKKELEVKLQKVEDAMV